MREEHGRLVALAPGRPPDSERATHAAREAVEFALSAQRGQRPRRSVRVWHESGVERPILSRNRQRCEGERVKL